MSSEETDAVPANISAIDDYYRKYSNTFLKSSSSETLSSSNSVNKTRQNFNDDYDSSTASDSDTEQERVSRTLQGEKLAKVNGENIAESLPLSHINSDAITTNQQAQQSEPVINSLAISNSTDVHIGNRNIYNAPVTIKQIVIRDRVHVDKELNGKINNGYEGSQSDITKTNKSDKDEVQADGNQFTIKGVVITRKKIMLASIIFTGVLALIILLILLSITFSEENAGECPATNNLRIISREQWQARPAIKILSILDVPVESVIIQHTVDDGCNTEAECINLVKWIQDFHMDNKTFDDIGYNFLVGGDGNVYEGRGWEYVGAHTAGYNSKSIGLGYMGDFREVAPNERQLNAGKLIVCEGVKLGKIAEDYKIYGACQFRSTESPGKALMEIIRTWTHWGRNSSNSC